MPFASSSLAARRALSFARVGGLARSRVALASVVVGGLLGSACAGSGSSTSEGNQGDGGGTTADAADAGASIDASGPRDGGGSSTPCQPCVTDLDCASGSACSQFAGDTYCAPTCDTSATCGAAATCQTVAGYDGLEDTVCVPTSGACGVAPVTDAGAPSDGGSSSGACGTLVPPATTASCKGCGTHTCQANGCYGGWYCDTATSRCEAPPTSGCTSGSDAGSTDAGDGGSVVAVDAGPPPTGSIGPTGGTVSRLFFAVVGDTRPASIDDNAGYPTSIITTIFQDIAKANPQFVAGTGDYQFDTPGKGNAKIQLGYYMTARAAFSGAQFPAMGNHECTGATASNCGTGNADGVTENLTEFTSMMLAPIGQSKPYYAITGIKATDGSWTAKLVFIAGNAWDSGQSSWLETTMAQPTTYTFVFRHEPASANTAPGVTPSEAILAKYPYTLKIVGHTHTYERKSQQEVLIGNGGAPLTSTSTAFTYGYGLFEQQADGSIAVDMVNYQTGATDPSFHFAVKADGSAAP